MTEDGEYNGAGSAEISSIFLTLDAISLWKSTIGESDTAEGLGFPISIPDYTLC